MNRFIGKQPAAAAYTVALKEQERQEIAKQILEFEQRQKQTDINNTQGSQQRDYH